MIKRMIRLASACAIVAMAFATLLPASAFAATVVESGTCGTCAWEIDSDGVFTVHAGTLDDSLSGWPSLRQIATIDKVVITENVSTGSVCYLMFAGFPARSMNLSGLNTSSATSMLDMFADCTQVTTLDLSNFDTSNVTRMGSMFRGCKALSSLNVSSFDTSSVKDMSELFCACESLLSVNVSGFSTANVTTMQGMFDGCSALTSLNVSNFVTTSVTDMSAMFNGCKSLQSLDVSNFSTALVTDMSDMFCACRSLKSLNLSSFNTSKVTDMAGMFNVCTSLKSINLSSFDASSVTSMYWMFNDCSSLESLNLSSFNPSSVENAEQMFTGCSSLKSLDLSSFNMASAKNMSSMFRLCSSLKSLNLSSFNASSVEDMSFLVQDCSSLEFLDLSSFDTTSVTKMAFMFLGCPALTTIKLGDKFAFVGSDHALSSQSFEGADGLWYDGATDIGYEASAIPSNHAATYFATTPAYRSGHGTCGTCAWEIDSDGVLTVHAGTLADDKAGWPSMANVTRVVITEDVKTGASCDYMFSTTLQYPSKITSMDLSGLDTSNATSMESMFEKCKLLTTLDLRTFDTSRVVNMSFMFNNCASLKSLNLSGWNTSKATSMASMFRNCSSLKSLNVSSFSTANVTDMNCMFEGCSSLASLDVSSFDTLKVASMNYVFAGCAALKKMTVGPKFAFILLSGQGDPYLPKQSFANADGKWYDAKTHVGFAPSEVPSLTAATYYATTPSSRGIAPKKGQTWTAKAGANIFTVKVKSSTKKSHTVIITKVKKSFAAASPSARAVGLASDDATPAISLMAVDYGYWGPAATVTVPSKLTLGDAVYTVVALGPSTFANTQIKTANVQATRVTAIPMSCFQNCTNLRSVTLTKSVKTIGARAFYGCKNLTTLRVQGTKIKKSTIGKKAFKKTYKKMKVYAPKKKLKTYKSAFTARGLSKKAKFKKI